MAPTSHPPCAQLYRVNVILQGPDAAAEPQVSKPPFFVLRRYTQFRQLYDQVRGSGSARMRNPTCSGMGSAD